MAKVTIGATVHSVPQEVAEEILRLEGEVERLRACLVAEYRPFHGLSPEEQERLALLMEELGESVQAVGKIFRHGYESFHPYGYKPGSNRRHLEAELGDVDAAKALLFAAGDLNKQVVGVSRANKLKRVGAYLHHQSPKIIGDSSNE